MHPQVGNRQEVRTLLTGVSGELVGILTWKRASKFILREQEDYVGMRPLVLLPQLRRRITRISDIDFPLHLHRKEMYSRGQTFCEVTRRTWCNFLYESCGRASGSRGDTDGDLYVVVNGESFRRSEEERRNLGARKVQPSHASTDCYYNWKEIARLLQAEESEGREGGIPRHVIVTAGTCSFPYTRDIHVSKRWRVSPNDHPHLHPCQKTAYLKRRLTQCGTFTTAKNV